MVMEPLEAVSLSEHPNVRAFTLASSTAGCIELQTYLSHSILALRPSLLSSSRFISLAAMASVSTMM
jgi:hypothetical protein